MEVKVIGQGIDETMEKSIKEKIIYAKKNLSNYNEMATYISKRMEEDFSGFWTTSITEGARGLFYRPYDGCNIVVQYDGSEFIVYKSSK